MGGEGVKDVKREPHGARKAATGGTGEAHLPSVLIAEDAGLVATELAKELRASGFVVVGPASTLTEALAAMDNQRCAGAIVDLNLQGESAVPLIRRLKGRGIPILVTTGYQLDTTLAHELKDVPYLVKPYRASDLVQRLKELVGMADQDKGAPS
jgi:DNA-binding response OmpR family regulator